MREGGTHVPAKHSWKPSRPAGAGSTREPLAVRPKGALLPPWFRQRLPAAAPPRRRHRRERQHRLRQRRIAAPCTRQDLPGEGERDKPGVAPAARRGQAVAAGGARRSPLRGREGGRKRGERRLSPGATGSVWLELRARAGAGVLRPWPCPESRRPHRSALRCAGRARGRPTERPRRAVERGQEAPAPAPPRPGTARGEPLPAGMRLPVPFPCPYPFPPHAGFCDDSSSGSCPPASSQVGLQRNSVSQPGTAL